MCSSHTSVLIAFLLNLLIENDKEVINKNCTLCTLQTHISGIIIALHNSSVVCLIRNKAG